MMKVLDFDLVVDPMIHAHYPWTSEHNITGTATKSCVTIAVV